VYKRQILRHPVVRPGGEVELHHFTRLLATANLQARKSVESFQEFLLTIHAYIPCVELAS